MDHSLLASETGAFISGRCCLSIRTVSGAAIFRGCASPSELVSALLFSEEAPFAEPVGPG